MGGSSGEIAGNAGTLTGLNFYLDRFKACIKIYNPQHCAIIPI